MFIETKKRCYNLSMETKDTRKLTFNRKQCEYCGHVYDKTLAVCPMCGRRNVHQKRPKDPGQTLLNVMKWIGIGVLVYASLIISVTAIRWILVGPTDEDGIWKWLYDILSGNGPMTTFGESGSMTTFGGNEPLTAFGGFAVLWTLFIVAIVWAVPVAIVIAILKAKKHRNEQDKAVYDKAYQLQKEKLEQEKEAAAAQKIIACTYCGGQARFGQGTCPHCGAALTKPK